jgi:hypothetical protein
MRKNEKLTTVSVTVKTRNYIKEEAMKLGITQSEYVERIVAEHKRTLGMKKKQKEKLRLEDMTQDEVLVFVGKTLEDILKKADDNRVISFIRKQESIFLNPMLNEMAQIKEFLSQLLTKLQQL